MTMQIKTNERIMMMSIVLKTVVAANILFYIQWEVFLIMMMTLISYQPLMCGVFTSSGKYF